MKKKIVGIFVCTLLIMTTLTAVGTNKKIENSKPILFNDSICIKFAPGEVIVKLKNGATFSRSSFIALNEKNQVSAVEEVFRNAENTILDNIYLLHVPVKSDILSIVQEYAFYPDVVYAEPNGIVYPCSIPNDINFSKQWSLQNTGQKILIQKLFIKIFKLNIPLIRFRISGTPDADIDAPEAWDIETGDPDIVIAIIDSGIDYTHSDLAANIWNNTDETPGNGIDDDLNGYIDDVMGWDFAHQDNDPKDGMGHGTSCAGVAAAAGNNSIGMTGVCWDCKIMPLQVTNETAGYATWEDIVMAYKYAADNGAKVISISMGDYTAPNIVLDAVNYAHDKGVFLCAAAGNNNKATEFYPAAFENVTAVGMTDLMDKRVQTVPWYGSNYGDWVDIAAPGAMIYFTIPTYPCKGSFYTPSHYDIMTGTSFATPMVAGVAALLLSKDPSLSPDEVKALLCGNVDPYISDKYIGTGRLNAYKALAALT